MALYQYSAIDGQGKKRSGLIEAQNEKEAREKLRDQGIMVVTVSTNTRGSRRQSLRGDNLLNFTVQLSQLVNAGIPLYQSLVTIEEQYRGEPFHRVLLSLCDQIKAGTPLSQAMSSHTESFDKLYRSMIAAGESAGALGEVLEKLALFIGKQMRMRRQIVTAMIYPAILATFALVVITLLMTFVLPSIEGIFEGRKLNGFTQFVLNVSYVFRTYWWVYLPLIVLVTGFLIYFFRTEKGRLWRERNFIKLPLLKTVMIQASVARFCRTLGTLQGGGLNIIESLQISRDVMHNVVLEAEVKRAEGNIVSGSSLSAELTKSKWFPKMVSRMLAVGEDTGTSSIMLGRIADMYEEEVEKSLDRVMAMAQPVILLFMGVVIGSVLLAILLPLTDISSLSM